MPVPADINPPCTLTKSQWVAQGGPVYWQVLSWRQHMASDLNLGVPSLLASMERFYKDNPVAWINHWAMTYDPRLPKDAYFPFIMFTRQEEYIRLLHQALMEDANVLVDKSRDMGVTWLSCAFSVWLWKYHPGSAIGWGSRVATLVDKLGDPKSIFEKMRIILRWLPKQMLPRGFSVNDVHCCSEKRILNPENGSSIIGEVGDSIGRGGRTRCYFKDESSHYEHPEMIEASLTSNTNIQIDISTVNGPATVFQRNRDNGKLWVPGASLEHDRVNVFVFDRTDHPLKTEEWYQTQKASYLSRGLAHIWAQEVDRDPSAAIVGTIIKSAWVEAAVDANRKLGLKESGTWGAGLDVADNGPDLNACAIRRGITLKRVEEWGDCRGDESARKCVQMVEHLSPIDVEYDCIGVGAAIKSEVGRLQDEKLMPKGIRFVPWMASASPLDPDKHMLEDDEDSPLNNDYFKNLKAQGWWQLGRRFERTWRAINEEGFKYDPDELISIDPDIPVLFQLKKEFTQPVMTKTAGALKMIVDKLGDGQRSPNLADCVMQAYWPSDNRKPIEISHDVMHQLRKRRIMRNRMRSMGFAY